MQKHLPVVFIIFLFFGNGELCGQDQVEIDSIRQNAMELFQSGKMQESTSEFEKIGGIYSKNENWEKVVENYNDLAYNYLLMGDLDKAISLLKTAIATGEEKIGKHTFGTAVATAQTGQFYSEKGLFSESLNYCIKAKDIFQELFGEDSKHVGRTYLEIGKVQGRIGLFSEAEANIQKAIEIKKKNTGDDLRGLIFETHALAEVKTKRLDFKSSKELLLSIDFLIRKEPELLRNPLISTTHYGLLALAFGNTGEFQKGISTWEKLEEIQLQFYNNPDHPGFAKTYQDWAFIYINNNEFEKADELLQKALKIRLKSLGEDHPLVADLYYTIGVNQLRKGNNEQALEYFTAGFDLHSKYSKNDFSIADAHYGMARALRALKRKEAAIQSVQKAIEIDGGPEASGNNSKGRYLNLWGEIYLENGDIDSALTKFQEVLILDNERFSSKNLSENPLPSKDEYPLESLRALHLKANAFLLLNQKSEETGNLKNAFNAAKAGVLFLNDLIRNSRLAEEDKLRYMKDFHSVFLTKINIEKALFEKTQDSKYMSSVFESFEQSKAAALLQSFYNARAKEVNGLDSALLQREKDLLLDIAYFERKSKEAIEAEDAEAISKFQNDYLYYAKIEYETLIRKIEKEFPTYYDAKYNFNVVSVEKVQTLLSEDELIVEYIIDSDSSELKILTISDTRIGKLKTVPIPENFSTSIKNFNRLIRKSTMVRKTSGEKFIKQSHELYSRFIEPILDQINDKKRLIFIGDGVTNYIPFEVLLKSNDIKPFSELDFLIKKYEILYHYSSTLFAKAREKEQLEDVNIYAFAPVYENSSPETGSLRKTNVIERDSVFRAYNADGSFSPLPESEREVKSILSLFEKGTFSENHLDLKKDATEESLKRNLQKPYKFIHIAGHSFADLKNPKFSGIACFDQDEQNVEKPEDGILYVGEIYNISSSADLVTLSSCESGFGKLERTEGLLGLNRAFIYAGAPNVIFSLWKVYDKISAGMMVDFYKENLSGKSYSAALRDAKLNLLKKEETASPHFWSPFLLIGR